MKETDHTKLETAISNLPHFVVLRTVNLSNCLFIPIIWCGNGQ